jgi:hypothetical protein
MAELRIMGGSEILMASQHGNKHGTLAIEPVSTRQGDMIQMVERYSSIMVSFIRQLSFAFYIIFGHKKIQALFSARFDPTAFFCLFYFG